MKLLNDYVYKSLSDFGNTFVMPKTYKKIGEEAILNDLKENGFDCVIELRECQAMTNPPQTKTQLIKSRRKRKKDVIYLITARKEWKNEKNKE